jgi:HTH-type transcriptional regulator / antitoxin HigA
MTRDTLDFTKPHLLRSDGELEIAIREIDELIASGAQAGTEAGERLEFLSVLVKVYEDEHDPLADMSPADIVDFMLDQRNLARGDLTELMGGRSRVSDFFNGKRELSKNQARALAAFLDVPIGMLLV